MAAAYGYDPEDAEDDRGARDPPALPEPALALDEDPALALADQDRALALAERPDPSDEPPGVDAVSGGSLEPPPGQRPPPPGGQLTPDQLMMAASRPPAAGDAVDREVAGALAPPPGPQAAPKPPTVQAQEQQAIAEGQRLGEEAVLAERRAGAARAKVAEAAQAEAAEKARLAAENAQREQAIVNAANARTQQWMDRSQAETDRYMKMGLHDYWEDKSTINKVLAGLSYVFGAAGGRSLAENPGYQMINGAIERDFRQQQAGIAKQKGNVDLARGAVTDSINQKQQELADNNLKKAAAFDAAAAQAVAMKLKHGSTLEEAQTDAAVVGLRQKANATRMETLKVVHGQNVQDAQLTQGQERVGFEGQRVGLEEQRVGLDKERLGIEKYRAESDRMLAEARARKLKGGGGGGGGGSADAMTEFTKAAGQLKPGEQIPDQVVALALKAGIKRDKIADQVGKYRNSGATSAATALKDDRFDEGKAQHLFAEMDKKLEGFEKDVAVPLKHGVRGVEVVKNDPDNPLNWVHLVDSMIRSNTGRAAIMSQYNLFMGHAAGSGDKPEQFIEKLKTGKPSKAQQDAILRSAETINNGLRKEAKEFYDNFRRYDDDDRIKNNPAAKQGYVARERNAFGTLPGYGGDKKEGGGAELPGGMKIVKVRDKETGAVIEAIKRPDGTLLDKKTGQPLQ